MTQEQKNIQNQPYVGMLIFMTKENCTYVIHEMSDKRIYMTAVEDCKKVSMTSSGTYKNHKKMWSNIDSFYVCLQVGTFKII